MHAERFGKALGFGMRQAGRAVARAAEAAAAPAPASGRAPVAPARHRHAAVEGGHAGGLRQGARQFSAAVVRPAKRAGSVLWLEVTGFLFGMIAAVAAAGVWAGRAHLRPGPGQAHELMGVGMLVVFGWFAGSNFVRARRRSRRP